ncbi:hypothetical protein PAL_GLEAN10024678 [Pteropus alecto]|uniref:Uncharacterized protein n=1 Tax=Pteropus alecto TaxID=9402 RepID=L5K1M6_PTEAL|nr:hypothetical protein PAL_GLEAN10024678 [Pteropus alecto]
MGCRPGAAPSLHVQVDDGVPGPACLDACWTLGPRGRPWLPCPLWAALPHFSGQSPPMVPSGLPPPSPVTLGVPPPSGHPEEVALVGLRDTVQGREHCPRRNPVWSASQTSHPPDQAQGPGPCCSFFPP